MIKSKKLNKLNKSSFAFAILITLLYFPLRIAIYENQENVKSYIRQKIHSFFGIKLNIVFRALFISYQHWLLTIDSHIIYFREYYYELINSGQLFINLFLSSSKMSFNNNIVVEYYHTICDNITKFITIMKITPDNKNILFDCIIMSFVLIAITIIIVIIQKIFATIFKILSSPLSLSDGRSKSFNILEIVFGILFSSISIFFFSFLVFEYIYSNTCEFNDIFLELHSKLNTYFVSIYIAILFVVKSFLFRVNNEYKKVKYIMFVTLMIVSIYDKQITLLIIILPIMDLFLCLFSLHVFFKFNMFLDIVFLLVLFCVYLFANVLVPFILSLIMINYSSKFIFFTMFITFIVNLDVFVKHIFLL